MAIKGNKWYSLGITTVVFSANFAAWTLFAIAGLAIRNDLGLSETAFGLLLAMPILTGAFSRLPCGILAQRYGGRIVFFYQSLVVAATLFILPYAKTLNQFLIIGLALGLSGGAFISGITYVSNWFERSLQGTVMGIFGASSVGAAINNLVAPIIVVDHGWQVLPFYYGLTILLLALVFWLTTSPDPKHTRKQHDNPPLSDSLQLLKHLRIWRFGLYYFFVFGGFLALILWLPQYYIGEYQMDFKSACFTTLLFILPGCMASALGGWFADNFGARRVNWTVFWVCLICLFFLSYPQTTMTIHGIEGDVFFNISINQWVFTLLIFIVGTAMGFGKASIFRIIHDYYPQDIGIAGGMVSAIGAFGGFALPIIFGIAADITGIRSSCFMLLYGMLAGCMVLMFYAIKLDAFQQRVKQAHEDDFLTL